MTNKEKHIMIRRLLIEAGDPLVQRFLDLESEKLLDEKIDVLTKLSKGATPGEIPNYYDILELYPTDKSIKWDL